MEQFLDLIIHILKNSILITGLVLIMMLMIEYFNIHTHGKWLYKLQGSKFKQVIVASILGMVPGCIGGFAAVSLYTHRLISFGALIAMMIVSSGDEAFIIMAMIPKTAIILFALLLAIGIGSGLLIDYVFNKKNNANKYCSNNIEFHTDSPNCDTPSIFKAASYRAMLHPSKQRIVVLVGIALFISSVIFGILECGGHDHQGQSTELCTSCCDHNHSCEPTIVNHSCEQEPQATKFMNINILNERWINILFSIISIITIFFTATAKEHFIKEHIWDHIIKKHLLSIFLWTFGTLMICQIGMQYINIEEWINGNLLLVLILAILIGIIPESGPHIIFITLFAQGSIPFYILLVNSIVQDGHSTLPLLAHNKIDFLKAKLINVVIGSIIGFTCYFLL